MTDKQDLPARQSIADGNRKLYERQVAMLKTFRDKDAISEEQYQTALRGLNTKMNL